MRAVLSVNSAESPVLHPESVVLCSAVVTPEPGRRGKWRARELGVQHFLTPLREVEGGQSVGSD